MTATQQAVLDALEYLMVLNREGVRPEAARARFRLLQQEHSGTAIDLVWEEEAYDGSVHYDALLQVTEGGTISLSFCPDRALPWPMRGAHRWSDADLVRINQRVLKVDEAIACLDFIWDEAPLIERLVNACLIQEVLEKEPIELSGEELQRAMDGFRRRRRLYTAADTHAWMDRHGITHQKLERLVGNNAIIARLRERVTAGKVETAFAARRDDFDTARIARLDLPDEESARRVCGQIRRGELNIYEAAQQRFLEDVGRPEVWPNQRFQTLHRGQAPRELAKAVFAAAPGEVVAPVAGGDRFAVIHVLSLTPACLDNPTRRAIEEVLFAEWLAERRRSATLEWCWGNARQTSRAIQPA